LRPSAGMASDSDSAALLNSTCAARPHTAPSLYTAQCSALVHDGLWDELTAHDMPRMCSEHVWHDHDAFSTHQSPCLAQNSTPSRHSRDADSAQAEPGRMWHDADNDGPTRAHALA
jgi:hypothetical protein